MVEEASESSCFSTKSSRPHQENVSSAMAAQVPRFGSPQSALTLWPSVTGAMGGAAGHWFKRWHMSLYLIISS